MKKLHLIPFYGAVLALALAVPALGGPLASTSGGSAGGGSLVHRAKRMLQESASVNQLSEAALATAGDAQDAVNKAQDEAAAAKADAEGARDKASKARAVAADAQTGVSVTENKLGTVFSLDRQVDSIRGSSASIAARAQTVANEKARDVTAVAGADGGGNSEGENLKEQQVLCSGGSPSVNLGFEITGGAAEPHVVAPFNGGAVIVAQSGGNSFNLRAFVMCLVR
jgi:hypothetical protein